LKRQIADVDFLLGHLLMNKEVRQLAKEITGITPNEKGEYSETQRMRLDEISLRLDAVRVERERQDKIHQAEIESGRTHSLIPPKKVYSRVGLPTLPALSA
jgi:hypothetical protein